jgi:ADP-L-glycero-D-manno-heptose 6-epimerase
MELAAAVFEAMGRPPNVEFIDMPDDLRRNYQYFTQADIAKLLESGYRNPIAPLRAAVADYIKNYLAPGKSLSAEYS